MFDLDGTLSDPLQGFVRCMNHALTASGEVERSESELARLIGPPLDEAFRTVLGLDATADVTQLVADYRVRYASVGYTESVMYSGIPELLSSARASGRTLGVCTSKRKDFAELVVGRFGIRQHFGFVDGGDVGTVKLQQLAALMAAGRVTRRSVMIGDRAVDIEAARANGMRSAGVLYGYGSRDEIEAAAPDWVVERPEELREVLDH